MTPQTKKAAKQQVKGWVARRATGKLEKEACKHTSLGTPEHLSTSTAGIKKFCLFGELVVNSVNCAILSPPKVTLAAKMFRG